MTLKVLLVVGLLALLVATSASLAFAGEIPATHVEVPPFNRSSFPKGFIFGTASSAYQYEGGGRLPSIWDNFTHQHPEKIADRSNGDIAIDQIHRYKEDIEIMKYMNLDAYRLSISWPRILPTGRVSGGINYTGVQYYRDLIKALKAKGIEPFVTIFHWDLPQALEEEYGGFLNKKVVEDFKNYADLCFKLFGKDVKHWITINEPHIFTLMGYVLGVFAPGRCSSWMESNCTGGDSGTEPYKVGHHLLLAHAETVRLYRKKYQKDPAKEKIGITLSQGWVIPLTNSTEDIQAQQRSLDFTFGWWMDPLYTGKYPKSMVERVGSRLPTISHEESKLLKGAYDFIGLNYYSSEYVFNSESSSGSHPSYLTDSGTGTTTQRNNVSLGPAVGRVINYPRGIRDILLYIKKTYNTPLVYITENGMDEPNDSSLPVEESLFDIYRIDYYYRHLFYVRDSIRSGANVQGYFAWSLLDNFEWSSGYTVRYGINFVDYNDNLKRYHKLSATWFKNFLVKNHIH